MAFALVQPFKSTQSLTVDQRQLSELAHPYLVRLVEDTGECSHAAVAVRGVGIGDR